jgi:hypothetical protein
MEMDNMEEYDDRLQKSWRRAVILGIAATMLCAVALIVSLVVLKDNMNDNSASSSPTSGVTQVIKQPAEPKFASNSVAAGALVDHLKGGSASCVKGQYNEYDCEYKDPAGKQQLMTIRVGDKNVVVVEHHQ